MFIRLASIVFVLFLTACTTQKFNNQYQGSNWNVIMLAPIDGEFGGTVENALLHEFATSSVIRFIEPEQVLQKASEKGLLEALESQPLQTLSELSTQFNANGFITGYVEQGRNAYLDSNANTTEVNLRLYDAGTGKIVASSVQTSSSVLFGQSHTLEDATENALDEFSEFFEQLNSSFDSSWF